MNAERVKGFVTELQRGDQTHFTELYYMTVAGAAVVAKKYLKSQEDQDDVLQEAYMVSLGKIRELKKPESYPSWLNQIVATRSLNMLRRKNPVMFSEMTAEEDDADIDFEDESPSFQPEKITDFKATAEAVEEVMNLLTEMQRNALWMHYGQEIPIKDIAEAAGVSVNTIKSRLKQGRGKLYDMRDEFRKRGIELTGVTIAVLLFTLFTGETEAQAAELGVQAEFQRRAVDLQRRIRGRLYSQRTPSDRRSNGEGKASSRQSGGNTQPDGTKRAAEEVGRHSGKTAAGAGAKAGAGIITKVAVVAAIAAAAVVGVFIGSRMTSVRRAPEPETETVSSSPEEETAISSTENVSEVASEPAAEPTETPVPTQSPDETAIEQYREVIAEAPSMGSFASSEYETDAYSGALMYALVTMEPGEAPTLLLAQGSDDPTVTLYFAKLYYYDAASETMYETTNATYQGFDENSYNFVNGTDESGSIMFGSQGSWYNSSLTIEQDGNGLQLEVHHSGMGEGTIARYTREGNTLAAEKQENFLIAGDMAAANGSAEYLQQFSIYEFEDIPKGDTIEWHILSDTSALDNWPDVVTSTGEDGFPSGEDIASQKTANADAASGTQSETTDTAALTDGDRTVLTGTIRVLSYDEVLALQGVSDPNPGTHYQNTFTLFILDEPQELVFMDGGGDGLRTGTASIIGLTYATTSVSQYNGQHVTASFDPNTTYWASDTGLPLGEPNAYDIHILSVG